MSGLQRYRRLAGISGVPAVVATGLLARLPLGMTALALVLLVRAEGGSYAQAGAVTAATALGEAAAAPLAGRLVDRFGPPVVLRVEAVGFAGGLGALVALAHAGAPTGVLVACAAAAGLLLPPVGAALRTLWPAIVGMELREVAFALEAALQELIFIVGPLVAAAVAAAVSATAAVIASMACALAGTLAFTSRPAIRAPRRATPPPRGARALRVGGLWTVLAGSMGMGAAFGIMDVAMPAFAELHATRAQGGFALAAFAAGSLVGGLSVGALRSHGSGPRRYPLLLCALAASMALPLGADSLPAMAALIFLAGLPIAPTFAVAYRLISDLAPAGGVTEAFAWQTTALVVGAAAGTAGGGAIIAGPGVTTVLAVAVGCVAAAAVVVALRRRTLAPPAMVGPRPTPSTRHSPVDHRAVPR